MQPYQDVFKRYEKKYLLEGPVYRALFEALRTEVRPDEYGETTIYNLYCDTPDRRLIRASLEKPVYKEKLRLRCYGMPRPEANAFLELKKKYKGVVYKRRVDMSLAQAEAYLNRKRCPPPPSQIQREIAWTLQYYPQLAPSMFLCYDRLAVCGLEDPNLRITFDTHILWRQENPSLLAGLEGRQLLQPDQCLMEIKIPNAMPLWLSRLLDQYRVYPTSFSKYGAAHLASLAVARRKEAAHCA